MTVRSWIVFIVISIIAIRKGVPIESDTVEYIGTGIFGPACAVRARNVKPDGDGAEKLAQLKLDENDDLEIPILDLEINGAC